MNPTNVGTPTGISLMWFGLRRWKRWISSGKPDATRRRR